MVYLHLCWRSGAMPYVPKLSIRMLQGTNTWIVWNHQFVRNMLMSLAEGVMGDICLRPSIHSCGECACQATDSRSTHQRVGQPKVFLRDTKFSHSNLNIRLMFTYKTWYFNTSHLHLRRSVSSPDFSLEFLDGKKITHPVITLWVEKPEVLGSYAWKRMPDYILNLIPGGFQLSRAYCQWGGDALKKGMVGVVFYLLIVDVCWYLYRLVYILYIYTPFSYGFALILQIIHLLIFVLLIEFLSQFLPALGGKHHYKEAANAALLWTVGISNAGALGRAFKNCISTPKIENF